MKKGRFHYGVQPLASPTMQRYAKAMCFEKRVCSTDPFKCELLHQKHRCLQSLVPAGPVPGADSVNSCQYKASLQRD